jgi:hypothetical protein
VNEEVSDAATFAHVQWQDLKAQKLNYFQQFSWVQAAENEYRQIAPALPVLNSANDLYGDAQGASEGELLGILGVETTLLKVIFGPLPKFDPVTQTFTPAKQ